MFTSRFLVASAAGVLLALSACTTQKTKPVAQQPPPEKPTVAAPQPKQVVMDGRIRSSYAFPTGHMDTSTLFLERDLPSEIMAGQEFTYEMKVTNIGHAALGAVTLRDECASQMTFVRAEPMPVMQQPPFVWNLGDLKSDESRIVRVTGKLAQGESFTSCASASYNSSVCLTAPIVEPALRVALTAPAEATPCDTLPVKIVVSNVGTGMARDVRLAYPLPEGWTTTEGKTTAQFTIDGLAANQSREFMVNVKPSKVGDFTSKATASAAPQILASSAAAPTAIRQAVLDIKGEGPQTIYPNRNAVVKFTVTNNGTGTAKDAIVEAVVPTGAKFISATESGVLRGNNVVWNLQTLPTKGIRTLAMTFEPTTMGKFEAIATAKAYCATPARDTVMVAVTGIPALLLEVTDLTDPIEVGSEVVYEIVITNQGSAPATNVRIAAVLEENQVYASAFGGNARSVGNAVTFDPVANIPPQGKVTLTLAVKCVKEGDTRFKISMTADQVVRPVEETESTHIYR